MSPVEYQAPALGGPQATSQSKEHVVGVVLLCPLFDTYCSIIPHTLLAHQTRPTPKSHPEAACFGWDNEEDLLEKTPSLRWRGGLGQREFGPDSPQLTTLDARSPGDKITMQATASPWSCRTPQRLQKSRQVTDSFCSQPDIKPMFSSTPEATRLLRQGDGVSVLSAENSDVFSRRDVK